MCQSGGMSSTAESSSIPQELFSVEELRRLTGLGRTTLYAEIKARRLVARKVGRRTVILRADFEKWAAELPLSRWSAPKRTTHEQKHRQKTTSDPESQTRAAFTKKLSGRRMPLWHL